MPITQDDRKPLTITDFRKGVQLKADALGEPGFMRLTGYKFGSRIGSLESRGGFSDWDLGTDFTYIQGFKRWYRSDGGVNTFLVGKTTGGTHGVYLVGLHNKSLASLYTILDSINLDEPALWVDCVDQLILILSSNSRPYSIKRQESESVSGDGGIVVRPLGLDKPTQGFALTSTAIVATIGNPLGPGAYRYTYSYVYGTPSAPELYGESEHGPIVAIQAATGAQDVIINQLTGLPTFGANGVIRKIRIYRTLADGGVFYRIGEIDVPGRTFFNDSIPDSEVDVSLTLQTSVGLPVAMTCANWHPTLKRLFWFDNLNRFRYSAAGFPDINPGTQYVEVGNLGYEGVGIHFILDGIYAFRKDGIFRIFGEAPNYTSRRVSSVQAVSRASLVEMPDGIYFLGVESGEARVYKFDGNNALPISLPIDRTVPYKTNSTYRRATAKRVGSEYWLSITTPDLRYALWPTPYNNMILPYDYRYATWAGPFPCQASSIEVFDGPGDKGEVFITESDFTNDANKGNLFRLETEKSTINLTNYAAGVRNYSKIQPFNRVITMGIFSSLTPDGLQRLNSFAAKLRVRGLLGENISCGPYSDASTLQQFISPDGASRISENLIISSELIASQKFGTTYGTGKYVDNFLEEYFFNVLISKPQTGIGIDFLYTTSQNRFLEIEALEVLLDHTRST